MRKKSPRTKLILRALYVLVYLCGVSGYIVANDFSTLKAPPWYQYPFTDVPTYPAPPQIEVDEYYLLDMSTGYVLAEHKSKDEITILASVTKLMTAYVIINDIAMGKYAFHDRFIVNDMSIFDILPYDASLMGLLGGDTPSIDELLKGLLVMSGNDAAVFLATISRGSVGDFVLSMNETARKLQLSHTRFSDPSGLSPQNTSSAEDIGKLVFALLTLENNIITDYTNLRSFEWNNYRKRNTNLLIGNYEGIDGMKTGYIDASGFNLVATASRQVLGTQEWRLLAIVIGANATTTAEGTRKRAKYAQQLLDYGYNNFDVLQLSYPNQEQEIWGGKEVSVQVSSSKEIVILPKNWIQDIRVVKTIPEFVWAPVLQDQKVGTVDILYTPSGVAAHDDIVITSLILSSDYTVKKSNIFKRTYHRWKAWRSSRK